MIDIGTSGVRASIVRPDGTADHIHYRPTLPSTPSPGFVEFNPVAMADAALDVALQSLAAGGPVKAVGIANQRSSTIVWDRATGQPVGPGIGWQDLRTVGTCLMLQAQGIRLAPNTSATKLAYLLDIYDYGRTRDLMFGTVDTWIAWQLNGGTAHVTDATNAGVTGLVRSDGSGWDPDILEALRIPATMLPAIIDSSAEPGTAGMATALAGARAGASTGGAAPPITGIAGDQQASLVGQGCTRPGLAKVTFGTGGMLDVCLGWRPSFDQRGDGGCFPIAAWRRKGHLTWGIEAITLSAGTAVEWLRDDLGLIATAAESEQVASQCADSAGVYFVPALLGLGTPIWDFGARGTLLGLTRGSGRAEVVRAVLEGVAHRGADLLEAAETDAGRPIAALRVDGGMSANAVFVQALANACRRPVEVSPVLEATTLGAAYLAGMAVGTWADEEEVARAWQPRAVVEPTAELDRDRWRAAIDRARGWIPELSGLRF
ncbi:MAG: FGGY-family carbohydrate kinase [Actinomycetota bacterium]|nr:FGGY-family carbohydrate kinase [Actinomycetota bacterium]MDQ6947248.1 FGGY-family carbohydrate kinase [Actinomycetota bacterium]